MFEDVPRSTARIAGHPIHPMLVPFPIVCFTGTLITDFVYWRTYDIFWGDMSDWLLTFGLIISIFVVIAGLTDFLGERRIRALPQAWIHGIGNAVALILAIFNAFVHTRDAWTSVVPTGLISVLAHGADPARHGLVWPGHGLSPRGGRAPGGGPMSPQRISLCGAALAGSAPEHFPVPTNREKLRRFFAGALPHRQTGPTLAGSAPEPFPVPTNRERLRRFLAGALPHRQTGPTLAGSALLALAACGPGPWKNPASPGRPNPTCRRSTSTWCRRCTWPRSSAGGPANGLRSRRGCRSRPWPRA